MSYKLRNRKADKEEDDKVLENENSDDYYVTTESEENTTDLEEQVAYKRRLISKKLKSPYESVVKDLEKLKKEDKLNSDFIKQKPFLNKKNQFQESNNQNTYQKNHFSYSSLFYIFISIILFISSFFLVKKSFFKENILDYKQIIDSQNEHLSEFSSKILKAGIDKIIVEKRLKPSVILLYTDQDKNYVHDFYLNISSSIKTNNAKKIYNLRDIEKDQLSIKSTLDEQKIILLDNLELLNKKSLTKLFVFIDEEDSLVKNCIIFISLYTNEKLVKKNLLPKIMDEKVYNHLSDLWNNDSEFDPILNRLLTFVVFVY